MPAPDADVDQRPEQEERQREQDEADRAAAPRTAPRRARRPGRAAGRRGARARAACPSRTRARPARSRSSRRRARRWRVSRVDLGREHSEGPDRQTGPEQAQRAGAQTCPAGARRRASGNERPRRISRSTSLHARILPRHGSGDRRIDRAGCRAPARARARAQHRRLAAVRRARALGPGRAARRRHALRRRRAGRAHRRARRSALPEARRDGRAERAPLPRPTASATTRSPVSARPGREDDITGWAAPALRGATWVHAGTQRGGDLGPEVLAALAAGGRFVALDAQGPLRRAAGRAARAHRHARRRAATARAGAQAERARGAWRPTGRSTPSAIRALLPGARGARHVRRVGRLALLRGRLGAGLGRGGDRRRSRRAPAMRSSRATPTRARRGWQPLRAGQAACEGVSALLAAARAGRAASTSVSAVNGDHQDDAPGAAVAAPCRA